jgi:cobalt-zinc-cadmium resistance protein CzcA
MFDAVIRFSLRNKLLIGLGTLLVVASGLYSFTQLPIDAIPDITNNQAQVLTVCPTLSTTEVEQFVTAPIEMAVRGIPGVVELRSISRFGLSVVTVVFEEKIDKFLVRQLVNEKLREVESDIPPEFGSPELAPVSTGLGEVLHYRVEPKPGYEHLYTPSELRTIQDWIVRRQLMGTPGVVEINSFGGYLKQYEVAISPDRLIALQIGIDAVLHALEQSNANSGGAYIEKNSQVYFIRTEGMVRNLEDIGKIVVANRLGSPVRIADIGTVQLGHALRYGAVSSNGSGEIVLGIVMMLKNENASRVIQRVKTRLADIQKTLPEGVTIATFLDRENLVNRTIKTVRNNLVEGALIVIFVLVLLVGNLRAGLIIASVIPLSMLFALTMMRFFGVTASLMSLGAIDFGLIVDGAVIVVEATLFYLHQLARQGGTRALSQSEMDAAVQYSSSRIMRSSVFGIIIILIVYLPILSLTGIEGKMFKPMAQTVSFALIGALLLSLTYVPVASSIVLKKHISDQPNFADKIMERLQAAYRPLLLWSLRFKTLLVATTLLAFAGSLWLLSRLGGEFIPTLDEGDIMMHGFLPPGSSLTQTLESHRLIQRTILDNFPDEVEQVVSKIGSAEIPTDPMAIETADNIILLRDKSLWKKARTKEELVEQLEQVVHTVPGMAFEFTQPIKMRFDEMMTGVRSDIAVKIFGENIDTLVMVAQRADRLLQDVPGLADLKVEQVDGQPQIVVQFNYNRLGRYGLHVQEVNRTVRAAFAGARTGVVFEDERRFDLVARLSPDHRGDLEDIRNLPISTPAGQLIPLKELADIGYAPGTAQISRDEGRRRIVVGANVRGRDVASVIRDVQNTLEPQLKLPAGYRIAYGGQFENLEAAKTRLSIAVPIALALIFVLLYFTFNTLREGILIFTAIPMSAIGGVLALWLRDMPFSISAGIGFIALFGVAVLNGIVLVTWFNQLQKDGVTDIRERILQGATERLRPVLMTASVASLGFLPMAISQGAGAEVQRPLATVVIGGLLTSTLLTLLVLPVLYAMANRWQRNKQPISTLIILLIGAATLPNMASAQIRMTEREAVERALQSHPGLMAANARTQQASTLGNAKPVWEPAGLYSSNAGDPDYGVWGTVEAGLVQNFPSKRHTLAQQRIHSNTATALDAAAGHTRLSILQEVRELFRHMGYLERKKALYIELDSLYQNFSEVAALRYATGAASLAERRQAADRIRRIRLDLETIEHETTFDQFVLGQLLGLQEPVMPVIEPSDRSRFQLADTARIYYTSQSQMAEADVAVAEANLALARAQHAPRYQAGMNAQYMANQKVYPGYFVGLAMPLARKGIRQREEAAEAGIEAARAAYQQSLLEQHVALGHLLHEKEKYEIQINYYESEGLEVARELRRYAKVQYQYAGMGYLEFLQNTEMAMQLELQYLENLYGLDRTLLELETRLGNTPYNR